MSIETELAEKWRREELGFNVAMIVPGILVGTGLGSRIVFDFLSGGLEAILILTPQGLGGFLLWLGSYAFISLVVTVPTTLIAGIPAYMLYRRMGWTGWPGFALGGAAIGCVSGYVAFGVVIWSKNPFEICNLCIPFLGAASAVMLWSVIYKKFSKEIFFGLVAVAALVGVTAS